MVSSVLISDAVEHLTAGLTPEDGKKVMEAYVFAKESYGDIHIESGELAIDYSKAIGLILAELNTDSQTRSAGLLAVLPRYNPEIASQIESRFGVEVSNLVDSVIKLFKLRDLTGNLEEIAQGKNAAQIRKAQAETLRKMLLAMAADMRVVMIRLAARMASLRYLAKIKKDTSDRRQYAKETLEIYAPLANRLGIWQVKWELEDLSFRFIEPDAYKNIAKSLEEKRTEREEFIRLMIERLKKELEKVDIRAEVYGRPKHIYSIYNKMRGKSLDFRKCTICAPCGLSSMTSRAALPYWILSTDCGRRYWKNSTITFPVRSPMVTSLCIRLSLPRTGNLSKCRYGRRKCTGWLNTVWQPIGDTRKQAVRLSLPSSMTKKSRI